MRVPVNLLRPRARYHAIEDGALFEGLALRLISVGRMLEWGVVLSYLQKSSVMGETTVSLDQQFADWRGRSTAFFRQMC